MRRLVTVSSAWQAARMDKRMPGAFHMRVTSRRRLRAAGWWCFRDRAAVFFPVLAVTHLSRTDEGVVFSCDGILPCDIAILSRSAGGLFLYPRRRHFPRLRRGFFRAAALSHRWRLFPPRRERQTPFNRSLFSLQWQSLLTPRQSTEYSAVLLFFVPAEIECAAGVTHFLASARILDALLSYLSRCNGSLFRYLGSGIELT